MAVDGKYNITIKSPMGAQPAELNLKADGNTLTGTQAAAQGSMDIANGKTEGDNVSFSGPLADLMATIMTAYDQDCPDGACGISPGEYVTASAVVLREILLENLEGNTEAEEFLEHISDALQEDENGTVSIATFALLDETAEHIDAIALETWLSSPHARAAIRDLAESAFA